MAPKSNPESKDDPKAKSKGKDEPKAKPLANEKDAKKGGDKDNTEAGCTTAAKALLYIVPLALYIPWAYRMFKGNACCPEIPKPPRTSHGRPHHHHHPKWPFGKGKGGSCGEGGEAAESPCGMHKEESCHHEEKPPKERDDCGKKSRQCLNKCLDKCLSKEGGRGKKRKEKRRNEDDDDDD